MRQEIVKDVLEQVSPIKVEPGELSLKVGISRRFLLFRFLEWLTRRIEDDPHLNFISILKSYKAFGNILHGTLYELHRDRNTLYFRNFFIDESLWDAVKRELRWAISRVDDSDAVNMTITKRGVLVYERYLENRFNVLLVTAHAGSWIRKDIAGRQAINAKNRFLEEDVATDRLYARLVLDKGGVWINNKASRFSCDYNRERDKAVYNDGSEEWLKVLWKAPLTDQQLGWLLDGYDEFYHLLESIVKSYQFNVILDGHSMKPAPGRAGISVGTHHIPRFYMPIVFAIQRRLKALGYEDVGLDRPFGGGHILAWMKEKFPNRFICTMEVNKNLYMTKDRSTIIEEKCDKIAEDLAAAFDISDEDFP